MIIVDYVTTMDCYRVCDVADLDRTIAYDGDINCICNAIWSHDPNEVILINPSGGRLFSKCELEIIRFITERR